MAALWNRADVLFLPCGFFFLLLSSFFRRFFLLFYILFVILNINSHKIIRLELE